MSKFTFKLDEAGDIFCGEIVCEMMRLFGFSEIEAVSRINREWCNVKLIEPDHPLYHEDATFWAKDIYYGHNSQWWKKEEDARPQPFPLEK